MAIVDMFVRSPQTRPGWRYLDDEEVIQAGDRFWGGSEWLPCCSSVGRTPLAVTQQRARPFLVSREGQLEDTAGADLGEGYRLLDAGDILQEGDEWKDSPVSAWQRLPEPHWGRVVSSLDWCSLYQGFSFRRSLDNCRRVPSRTPDRDPAWFAAGPDSPGEGWRWLAVGEQIQPGDEFWATRSLCWMPAASGRVGEDAAAVPAGEGRVPAPRVRRELPPASVFPSTHPGRFLPGPGLPGEGWRWLGLGEKIQTADEFWGPLSEGWVSTDTAGSVLGARSTGSKSLDAGRYLAFRYRRRVPPPETSPKPASAPPNALRDAYLAFQAESGIEVGDMVKVVRDWPSRAGGWDGVWWPNMTSTLGEEFRVTHVSELGIRGAEAGYTYPVYALELVRKKSPPPEDIFITVNGCDYEIQFLRDSGDMPLLRIGCTTLWAEQVEKIIQRWNALKEELRHGG